MSYFKKLEDWRLLKFIFKTETKVMWSIERPILHPDLRAELERLRKEGYLERLTETIEVRAPSWVPYDTMTIDYAGYQLTEKGKKAVK